MVKDGEVGGQERGKGPEGVWPALPHCCRPAPGG